MSKYFFIALFIFFGFLAQAQQEVSLPMLQDIPNSIHFNPAFTTGYKWTVSLPSISNNLASDGPSLNDLFEDHGDGTYTLHVADAINALKDKNLYSNTNKLEILGLSHQWKNSFVHFNVGTRTYVGVEFPKNLAEIAAFGNAPYIGQTLKVGPGLDIQSYSEVAIGYAHQFGQLHIGATVKFLNGIASVKTSSNSIELYTDPEYYQITATTDYVIQSSSILDLDSLGNLDLDAKELETKFVLGNGGTAFDLGVVYEISDKLTVSASAIDIGSIFWNDNASTLTSKGTFTYDGFNADGGLSSIDSTSLAGLLDSVQNVFNFTKQSEKFETPLARKFTLGAQYKMGKTTLNAMLDATSIADQMRPSFSLGARTYVANWVALGGVLSYKNEQIDHLGLNATFKLGPVQLYLLSDNALSYIMPKDANDFHFRAGLNLVFGQVKDHGVREILTPHL